MYTTMYMRVPTYIHVPRVYTCNTMYLTFFKVILPTKRNEQILGRKN